MKTRLCSSSGQQSSFLKNISGFAILVVSMIMNVNVSAQSPAVVNLGAAGNFAVLSGADITETTGTTIDGNVGASPITGAAIDLIAGQVSGIIYTVDAAGPAGSVMNPGLLTTAKNNLTTAYNDVAGRTLPTLIVGGTLGGLTLPPGLYKDDGAPASLSLTGTLTLDAMGDPSAVWIFQSESTLNAEVDSIVVLANGAEACNVFWQIGSSATLKTRAIFKGVILADQSIAMQSGATLEGRALASIGGITFDENTVGLAACGSSMMDAPTNTTASCDNIPTAPVVTLTEACSTQSTVAVMNESILPGSCPNSYTISRVWSALNGCGDSISSTQLIAVADTTAPSITCPLNPIVVLADTNCVGTVPDLRSLVQFTDNCGTNGVIITQVPPSGTTFSLQTNVTLTATDSCGNTNQCIVSIVSPCVPGIAPLFSVEKLMTNQLPPMVGEPMSFVITIVNTGAIELVTVPVADTYDPQQIQYVNANPPSVDNLNDGLINWTNVGPLLPGASTSIVVNFIASCASVGTNTVLVSPTTPVGTDPELPLLTTAQYEIMPGALQGNVWIDLNGDGITNENLAVQGINGVTVRLYEITPGVTSLVAQTVTATVNGERGSYSFTNRPTGEYRVNVDVSTLPPTLPLNTTPLQRLVQSTSCGDFPDANFGFMPSNPSAVELINFTASADGVQVRLAWETLMELNTAGYNLYRATTAEGSRKRINTELLPGSFDGSGRQYAFDDPEQLGKGEYYYWLEDVEFNGTTRTHGPARVRIGEALLMQPNVMAAQTRVALGSASSFGVLGASTATSTGGATIDGDLGVSPGSTATGSPVVNGEIYLGDAVAAQAKYDLTVAYNDAAGRSVNPIAVAGNIGGLTLAPGLYKSTSSLEISSADLTLDGQGNTNAVWIFQIASTLVTTAGRRVVLTGGAQAANVYWQVGSSATIGSSSVFKGTIMADQSITLVTLATLDGRALALNGAVTMDGNTIMVPGFVVDIRVAYDFDNDDAADVTVFNRDSGNWYILQSGSSTPRQQNWGWSAVIPVPADYDGDTVADIAVYLRDSGMWYILLSKSGQLSQHQFGWSEGYPVPADYDGDGRADLAIYHRASATWYILQTGNGQLKKQVWGWGGIIPVPGDYDGDGKTDLAVFDPRNDTWHILQSSTSTKRQQRWGYLATMPVPGDYDGDGTTDIAVFEPNGARWHILQSRDNTHRFQQWGWRGTTPAVADYDGDGRDDITIYNQPSGEWYIINSSTGNGRKQAWGWNAAEPVILQQQINKRILSY